MTKLKIVATLVVKAAYKADFVEALHIVTDETRKEKGCISYDLHQDVKNSLKYVILEVWESESAIQAHNESKHFKEFVGAIEGKIDELTIDVIKQVY